MQPQLGHITVEPSNHSLIPVGCAGFIVSPFHVRKMEFVLVFQSHVAFLILLDEKRCDSFNKLSRLRDGQTNESD